MRRIYILHKSRYNVTTLLLRSGAFRQRKKSRFICPREISHLATNGSREINSRERKKVGEPNHSGLRYRLRVNARPCQHLPAHSFIPRLSFFTSSSSSSSFLPSLVSQPPYPRVLLRQIVSLACLPTQIINRRDLCRFLESGPERKGREAATFFFRLLSPYSRHPRFFRLTGMPLGYRGCPINQVRARGYKMNIGEQARHLRMNGSVECACAFYLSVRIA